MEIFKWLDNKNFVSAYIIKDFREFTESYYLNLEIQFQDDSVLYVREYVEARRRKYAYHWQKNTGELIIRWDNAPHFPAIPSFPHHKHVGEISVQASSDISLEDILQYIQNVINTERN